MLYAARWRWQGQSIFKRQVVVYPLIVGSIVGAAWCYGAWRIPLIDDMVSGSPVKRISVVQGNIDQTKKWVPAYQVSTVKKYIALTQSEKKHFPDLVIWPETAMPFYFSYQKNLTKIVIEGIQKSESDIILGSPAFKRHDDDFRYYNRAYLVLADGKIVDEYDKAHLVPFGEYVPFKKWLPFLGKMVEQVGDFSEGITGKTLEWEGHRVGVLICYELIFPYLARAAVNNGADVLINITNDAWYGISSAPYQHFSMAVFRAVENRRTLVRSANTGISGFIDPAGRIVAATPIFEDAVVTETVPILKTITLYTRFGDLFAIACTIGTILCIIRRIFSIRRSN